MALELYQSEFEIERKQRQEKIIAMYKELTARYPDASMNRICRTIGKEVRMSAEGVRTIVTKMEV